MSQKSLGERNYQGFAYRYARYAEDKAHNAHYERPGTFALLPNVQGKRVLDAGCGPGIYAQALLEWGAEVVAVDVTTDFVDITKERLAPWLGGRATVLQANLERPLTFAGEASFDGVLCTLVLDYLLDWRPTLAEFRRALKPGGWLLFSCGHPLGDWLWLTRTMPQYAESYFDTRRFTAEWHGFGDPPVPITAYRRPLAEMLNPLAEAGLCLERVHEPRPNKVFKERRPEEYETLIREPGFITVLARKPS
ncbi:MAG: class I SAM-dependent methyltransferase [Chloroflexota bacterium]|jgi:SAM-dependent methyltransferase